MLAHRSERNPTPVMIKKRRKGGETAKLFRGKTHVWGFPLRASFGKTAALGFFDKGALALGRALGSFKD